MLKLPRNGGAHSPPPRWCDSQPRCFDSKTTCLSSARAVASAYCHIVSSRVSPCARARRAAPLPSRLPAAALACTHHHRRGALGAMNASLKFRREEGPLFRLKAPVRAVVFPLVVGATYTVADGAALRVGSTLPIGLAWRLQFWPWGACPPAVALQRAARCCSTTLAACPSTACAATHARCRTPCRPAAGQPRGKVPAAHPGRRAALGRGG